MKKFLLIAAFSFSLLIALGQSTLEDVTSIFQANCTGCHSGSAPAGSLDLSGTPAGIYAAINKVNPSNLAARGEGMKRVAPGYPAKSFLLKKINNHLEPNFELGIYEGAPCPQNAASLADAEIELVRQWIQAGAPETGVIFNQHLINEYYTNGGKPRITPPQPPSAGQGIQIHYGPFFLGPRQETELFKKHAVDFPDDVQVHRIEVRMNTQSHHFILWKFYDDIPLTLYPDGIRNLYSFPNVLSANSVYGWQYSDDLRLPANSAYFWKKNTVLDLDYHLFNYPPDSILAAEVFINIFYHPKGTVEKEMISMGEIHEASTWHVPADGQLHAYSGEIFVTDPARAEEEWDVWLLSSHTHKYGLDFDIYLRNPDGTRGGQIYEGFFDTEYKFNTGFYNFSHPPIRRLETPIRVKASEGLIYEATFRNTGTEDAYFGPTTNDEMLVAYYQYTVADKTTALAETSTEAKFTIFPNPAMSGSVMAFDLKENAHVIIEIFDMVGSKATDIARGNFVGGSHVYNIPSLPGGVYQVRLTADGVPLSRQLVSLK